MKATFLFLLCFLFLKISFAQTLPEFAPIGSKWTYQVYDFSRSYTFHIFSQKKDTILGIECKQLNNYPGDPDTFYVYRDSLKIYFYHSGFKKWRLLYDFTKNIGESYVTYASSGSNIDSMIVSIISKGDTFINGYVLPYAISPPQG